MKKRDIFLATFEMDAENVIKKHGIGIEFNQFCISSTLFDERRDLACRAMQAQLDRLGLKAPDDVVCHGPFTEILPEAIDTGFVDLALKRVGQAVDGCKKLGVNVIRVDAKERFLSKLAGVTEPEKKRKIIGNEFIRVFEDESKKLGKIDVLAQGTIYPDVIESGKGDSAVIKSHHNVGGLPERMSFEKIVEPLRELFKDEVREVGIKLGIPEELVYRQPFPGPGLAVRVIGEITEEKLLLLRSADAILREEIGKEAFAARPDQYFAVITNTRSVGVMGDDRTYGYTVVLRAVTTDDFMTAEWTRLPYDMLEKISGRITNEIKGITRVVYDITSKPPATVEWE